MEPDNSMKIAQALMHFPVQQSFAPTGQVIPFARSTNPEENNIIAQKANLMVKALRGNPTARLQMASNLNG